MISKTTFKHASKGHGCLEIPVVFFVAAGFLTILGFLLAHPLLKNAGLPPVEIEKLRDSLIPEIRGELHPEPVERWLFILLVLASPFCVLAGLIAAQGAKKIFHRIFSMKNSSRPLAGAALLAGLSGVYLLHGKSLFLFFVYPASPLVDMAILGTAAWLLFAACQPGGPARYVGGMRTGKKFLGMVMFSSLALGVVLLPLGLGVRSVLDPWGISPFAWTIHFQAFAYPLTQVLAGKPLLTTAPPLYGYFEVFLVPVFKLIGISVFKVCLVMAGIQAMATLSLAWIAFRFIRTPWLIFLYCAALLYFTGGHCLVGRTAYDPYFQYWPLRFVFPAVSIPIYLWAARRNTGSVWMALGGFAGCALMWNLESGIAVAGAVFVALAVEAIGQSFKFPPRGGKADLLQPMILVAAAMIVTAAAFWIFLQVQAGWKPPLHHTVEYQRLFYQSGLMMTPMPLALHPWWLVAAVYLLGLCFGIRESWNGRRNSRVRLTLFLSVLGTGLFTYYQGRSNDFNLLSVSWPAVLLGFVFTDRLLRAIKVRLLPAAAGGFALPAVYLGIMAVAMFPGMVTQLWSFGFKQWRVELTASANATANAMSQRIGFIRKHVGADGECAILANFQAVYFAETGLRSSLDAPGLTELLFMRDLELLRSSLAANPPRHLFADDPTLEKLRLSEFARERYRLVAKSPDGKLLYLEPLSSVENL